MLRLLYAFLAIVGIIGLSSGFFGALHPAFDTLADFRWHLALLLLAMAISGLLLGIRRAPFILMLFALLGVWQSGAGNRIGGEAVPAQAARATAYKLLHFNLRFDNQRKDDVLAMISDVSPDIVSVNENSRPWAVKLETLKPIYPYSFQCPEWNRIGGTMIRSRHPLRADRNYCHAYAALGMSEVLMGEKWIEIGVVHLRWPWPASGPDQLAALEPHLGSIGPDAIIAGDFNATTWSHAVQRFAERSGMTVATGFGGTWIYKLLPSMLAPGFGLPIDNAMAKGSVVIQNISTLSAVGSDHLPLLIEFSVSGQ